MIEFAAIRANSADIPFNEFSAMRKTLGLAAEVKNYKKLKQEIKKARTTAAKLRGLGAKILKKVAIGGVTRLVPFLAIPMTVYQIYKLIFK